MAVVKEKFGQYMTPDLIADLMLQLISKPQTANILEPSSGKGIFLEKLAEAKFQHVQGLEIDADLIPPTFNHQVINQSFVSHDFGDQKFDVVIGNPPYIRWKNLEDELKEELTNSQLWQRYCNSLCDYAMLFILKSIELLKDQGELIFITPEYWMSSTHGQKVRDYMLEHGSLEKIILFDDKAIFHKVTVSLIIFKYRKGGKNDSIRIINANQRKKFDLSEYHQIIAEQGNDIKVFDIPQFSFGQLWSVVQPDQQNAINQFESACTQAGVLQRIDDVVLVSNGMVSGLDKAFNVTGLTLNPIEQQHCINVIKAKDMAPFHYTATSRYFLLNHISLDENQFKIDFPNLYKHLRDYVEQLEQRYQYNEKIDYWNWVFLRNYKTFQQDLPRIFVPCKERISNKDYFRFCYAEAHCYPTQDVTALTLKEDTTESIYYILAFLNSKAVFQWLSTKGIIKGAIVEFSAKPIKQIPFRRINFAVPHEKTLHDDIAALAQQIVHLKDLSLQQKIEDKLTQLLSTPQG